MTFTSVCPSVFRVPCSVVPVPSAQKLTSIPASASQNVTNKSCLVCVKSKKYASWVTLRPQWDRCRQGEAKVCILDFKTKWSEFQMPSQTAPAEATPSCVYWILKPHGQSSRCKVRLLPPRQIRGGYTQFWNHIVSVSSPPQSWSQVVVCVSTPMMYLPEKRIFPCSYHIRFESFICCL